MRSDLRRVGRLSVFGGALLLGACNPLTQGELQRIGACAPEDIIEDAENGDGQAVIAGGRAGYLYTYVDEAGSSIEPGPGDFRPSPGGPAESRFMVRINGTVAGTGHAYAGVGIGFVDPKAAYDASGYQGISFFAKAAPGSENHLRLKIPDTATDPDGGQCTECFNDFGIDFAITEEWTRYVVRWSDLAQSSGWGSPQPEAINPAGIYGVQWQVGTPGASYDIAIDDVAFVGDCAGSSGS